MHLYQYSLSELENMMPWEREVFTGMLVQHLQTQKNNEAQHPQG